MMSINEKKSDCGPVEEFIWDHLAFSYGCEFSGVYTLSKKDLIMLKELCEQELNAIQGK